ncbi:MAG TPA: rhomboid family intramembrane serine protease [Pseudomonadota bacterium]|jgi:rhomboid protease GluP|nr:rhomboid family intramembrane serine protease [Pseudomonadota bacterium]HNF97128.1 rhomboid family intramembrane serine protease [Pseudomonadota bacterium]HNI59808.1 rhomboid family intramembrane serine protease [Pseudomonadota bacterium]HNK45655.1 rhomboid family intramembrane serine protease [Pseudomonadota bacterium]HNN52589.1 rhomboid family intramembrane serine protease [Pseudomonadota bacterium]
MSSSEGSSSWGPFFGRGEQREPMIFDEMAVFAALLRRRKVRVTFGLIGLYVVLFALSELWGGSDSVLTLVAMGAEVPQLIKEGQYFRLLSATALHGGLLHILLNSYVLYSFGPFLEKLFGWQRFTVLYIVSGLCGTLLGTLLGELVGFQVSVGASGSLFGLIGAAAVLGFRDFGLPADLVTQLRKNALINLGLNVLVSLRPHVDWVAHLGGLVAGVILLLTFVKPKLTDEDTPADKVFAGLAILLVVALIGSAAIAIWVGQPWQVASLPS